MCQSNNLTKNWTEVKCPYCQYVYHSAEIFYPGDLTGTPSRVIRNPLNQILYVDYARNSEPVLEETYCCDNCKRAFRAKAKLSVEAIPENEETDFSTDSASLL